MADVKITALTAAGTVTADDLFVVVDDPSGTEVTKKATAGTVLAYIDANVTPAEIDGGGA